jgi:hypothetical protein
MTSRKRHPILILGLAVALAVPACGGAQEEHPEHPEESQEHPEQGTEEHPEGGEQADLTVDQLADAIAAYVQEQSGDEGYMTVNDPVTEQDLELKLDKVHRERLSKVGPDTYFACADFVSRDGVTYDLDVFMKGTDPEALEFHDLTVHKVAGEPRYTWYEEDGTWKKKAMGEAAEEHPEGEHPEESEEHEEHPEGGEEQPEGGEEHPEGGEEHPD